MIEVSRYQREFFDILCMLHESQKSELATTLAPENLPEIGYLVYDSATPIAAGFLRRLEGGYAMIDTMVTNGDLTPTLRHEGLSVLVKQLIDTSILLGLKGIISLTSDDGVISRAKSLGFKEINQSVISLSL